MVSVILGVEIPLAGSLFLFHLLPNPFVVAPLLLQVHLAACFLFFYGTKEIFSKWSWRLGLLPNSLGAAVAIHVSLSFVLLILLPFGMFALEAPQHLWFWGFFFASFAVCFDFAQRDTHRKRMLPTLIFLVLFSQIFVVIGFVVVPSAMVSKSLFATPSFHLLSAACGVIAILAVVLKCRNFIRAKGTVQPLQVEVTRNEDRRERPLAFLGTNARLFHWRFGRVKRRTNLLMAAWMSFLSICMPMINSGGDVGLGGIITMFSALFGIFIVNAFSISGKVAEGLGDLRWQSLFPLGRGRFLKEYYGALALDLWGPNLLMAVLALLASPFPACRGVVTLFVINLCAQPLLFGVMALIVALAPGKKECGLMWFCLLFGTAAALLLVLPRGGLPPGELLRLGAPLALLGLGAGALMTWLGYRRLMNSDLG